MPYNNMAVLPMLHWEICRFRGANPARRRSMTTVSTVTKKLFEENLLQMEPGVESKVLLLAPNNALSYCCQPIHTSSLKSFSSRCFMPRSALPPGHEADGLHPAAGRLATTLSMHRT